MAYSLIYNGMQFLGILTTTFDQEPVRDDSNTDTWYDKFTISIEAIINIAVFTAVNKNVGVIGNRVQGASASETCQNIQALMEDRKPFQFIQDGRIVVESDARKDANNGPRVIRKSVKPMGRNSARVQVTFEVSRVTCSENVSPVLGNRWQVIDEVDDQWRTTRTWRGKLRLCNSVNNPQAFRNMVVPQLSDGFQRVRMHFAGELNALELSYEVVDRQLLGDAPPSPCLNMVGTHTEAMDRNGASSVGEVFVRLDGPPGTDKQVMIEQAMRIIGSKVQADKFRNNKNWQWIELIITDHFGPNVCAVDARARVNRALDPGAAAGGGAVMRLGNMVLETLGRPLDLGGNYVRFKMVPPELYPCTNVGLFACFLQSPCVDNHAMPQTAAQIDADDKTPGRGDYEPSVTTYDPTGPPLEIDSPGYSDEHKAGFYSFTSIEWIVAINEGVVQLPYGDSIPGSKDTSAMIRLNEPTARATMKMGAERIGDWPTLPDRKKFKDPNGITYTPLQHTPNFRPREQQGDGRELHVVDIVCVFAMSRAPSASEFFVPPLPWGTLGGGSVPPGTFKPLG